ncbi:MAG: hypothetical protein HOH29_03705 [Cellvibrionales bacterium]|jgi:hypothetical protein|nr:hypothetical protein [Cellvibrionales bacterium]MBT5922817.1 hypothetical protein [Cellvibrionales bacterium]
MKVLKNSFLMLAITSSAASNAAMVFDYSNGEGSSFNQPQFDVTVTNADDGQEYRLQATTTSDRALALQAGGTGLGVGLSAGANPWWIGSGESITFALFDSANNAVDFTLSGFATAPTAKLGWDERVTVDIAGNSYSTGGNNANTAESINLSDANAMSTNPLYPNARGSQHGWGADGADGADVDSSFTLTGAAAVNGQTTNYRLQSVTLELAPTAVPVPAAAWLFGSAMVGLVGISRKRSAV